MGGNFGNQRPGVVVRNIENDISYNRMVRAHARAVLDIWPCLAIPLPLRNPGRFAQVCDNCLRDIPVVACGRFMDGSDTHTLPRQSVHICPDCISIEADIMVEHVSGDPPLWFSINYPSVILRSRGLCEEPAFDFFCTELALEGMR